MIADAWRLTGDPSMPQGRRETEDRGDGRWAMGQRNHRNGGDEPMQSVL
ncbi:MAG: hypothetical protein MUD01_10655 [Chloroflexaceae bacterium]|nr:hypothetical protein [Chloroflexaceae bacterium]